MKAIAAVDKNWAIGYEGSLLARIPEDQKFFRNTTMGHCVVLGRKTLEEFPGGKPLKGRENIILSTNTAYKVDGAVVVHSIKELIEILKDKEEVFLIGGASVYKELVPYCSEAILTKLDFEFEADAYFPNLDLLDNWEMTETSEIHEYNGIKFSFTSYKNKKIANFE